jgi:hypothetical protein
VVPLPPPEPVEPLDVEPDAVFGSVFVAAPSDFPVASDFAPPLGSDVFRSASIAFFRDADG